MGPNLKKSIWFDNNTVLNIAIDLLFCLEIIHNEGIIYDNIKLTNIVWDCFSENYNKPKVILIDFIFSIDNLSDKNFQKSLGIFCFGSVNHNINNIVLPKDGIESL